MSYKIIEEGGRLIEATVDIQDGEFFLESRSGKKGTPTARNPQYSDALKKVLHSLHASNTYFEGAYVASRPLLRQPLDSRLALTFEELHRAPDAAFKLISGRIRSIGKAEQSLPTQGNAQKRLQFVVKELNRDQLATLLNAVASSADLGEPKSTASSFTTEKSGFTHAAQNSSEETSPSPSTSEFADYYLEGSQRLVEHFSRERSRAASLAKRREFRSLHGRLYCEECGLDPVEHYGDAMAEACLEVHHNSLMVSKMTGGHKTSTRDLQLLCANCHRLVHRRIAESGS